MATLHESKVISGSLTVSGDIIMGGGKFDQ